jgi:hypothetical protein
MIKKLEGSGVVSAITFVGKLDMSYEFFIEKIFSKKVTSQDSKNVPTCISDTSNLITKNQ